MNIFKYFFSSTLLVAVICESAINYKICDKTQKIAIDSALTEPNPTTGKTTITLFSGEEVYELEAFGPKGHPKIQNNKSLAQLAIHGPINSSHFEGQKIILRNTNTVKEWVFTTKWKLYSTTDITSDLDVFEVINSDNMTISLKYLSIDKDKKTIGFTTSSDKTEKIFVKRIGNANKSEINCINKTDFTNMSEMIDFTELNGTQITSAFIIHEGESRVWYLMAGRLLCQMKIKDDDWLPFCSIQDISEWIDCNPKTDSTENEIFIIIILLIAFILILFAVIFWFFLRQRKQRYKEKDRNSESASFEQSLKSDHSLETIHSITGRKTKHSNASMSGPIEQTSKDSKTAKSELKKSIFSVTESRPLLSGEEPEVNQKSDH